MKTDQVKDLLNEFDESVFQDDLIQWFNEIKRDLPWRNDQDPYKVWVSEIMLQQTKVDTVIPYFEQFISKFPTLNHLADADEQDVLKAWEGLGYYSRARNLQTAVREVVEKYNSKVPDDTEALGSLKGVGPYTKGAILSIAYGKPEPAVDGNVMRVMSRVLKIEQDIAKQSVRRLFESCIKEIISESDPSSFNQGLMELGALICTPKSPSCLLCPVQEHCQAFQEGIQEQLPIKSKAKKQKALDYYSLVIKDNTGQVLIEQRPESGLLANMWQFPMVLTSDVDKEHLTNWVKQMYGIEIKVGNELGPVKHVFSHVKWNMKVLEASVVNGNDSLEQARFVSNQDLENYPFPVPHQKIIKQI